MFFVTRNHFDGAKGFCASRRIDEATGYSNDGHAEHTKKEAIIKFQGKGIEILLQIAST